MLPPFPSINVNKTTNINGIDFAYPNITTANFTPLPVPTSIETRSSLTKNDIASTLTTNTTEAPIYNQTEDYVDDATHDELNLEHDRHNETVERKVRDYKQQKRMRICVSFYYE